MATLTHVILFSLIGGAVSLLGGILLLSRRISTKSLALYATPFAAGALLAAVFLDLLHEGVEESDAEVVFMAALIGILLFFFAEKFLRWFHHHHSHEGEKDPSVNLIIAGDTIHNVLDGVAIASAFLVNVPTGIITTLAVAAHEIPQEIGDFGLLLAKGVRRRKVLIINALSALATTVAAVVTFVIGNQEALPLGVMIGLSAGFLLYIALSDIIPEIHEQSGPSRLLDVQPFLLVIGAVTVGVVIELMHGLLE